MLFVFISNSVTLYSSFSVFASSMYVGLMLSLLIHHLCVSVDIFWVFLVVQFLVITCLLCVFIRLSVLIIVGGALLFYYLLSSGLLGIQELCPCTGIVSWFTVTIEFCFYTFSISRTEAKHEAELRFVSVLLKHLNEAKEIKPLKNVVQKSKNFTGSTKTVTKLIIVINCSYQLAKFLQWMYHFIKMFYLANQ